MPWDVACTSKFDRPLPSSKNPHFQNEAKCSTFLVKISFICMRMKNYFHIKGWALDLVLMQRHRKSQKWPILMVGQPLISLFGREKSLNFTTFLFMFLSFKCYFCTADTTASHTQWLLSFCKVLLRKVVQIKKCKLINRARERKKHKWLRWVF